MYEVRLYRGEDVKELAKDAAIGGIGAAVGYVGSGYVADWITKAAGITDAMQALLVRSLVKAGVGVAAIYAGVSFLDGIWSWMAFGAGVGSFASIAIDVYNQFAVKTSAPIVARKNPVVVKKVESSPSPAPKAGAVAVSI